MKKKAKKELPGWKERRMWNHFGGDTLEIVISHPLFTAGEESHVTVSYYKPKIQLSMASMERVQKLTQYIEERLPTWREMFDQIVIKQTETESLLRRFKINGNVSVHFAE